jgi:stress response protein YsnF
MKSNRPDREPRRIVPIVAERLRAERRRGTVGRVRVTKKVQSREVVVDEPELREDVRVRRVAVGRFVDGPVPDRYVDGRLIVSILEEVPVVVRRLRVVEELHIERRRRMVRRPQRVTVRREEPVIARERVARPARAGARNTMSRVGPPRRDGGNHA